MEQSLAPLGVLAPFAIVERAVDKRVASSSVTFIVIPVAVVLIAIEVVHDAMSLLIIAIPQADVLVVVQEVIRAVSVLMTIHPRALVAFAVGKREGAFALSSSAHVFAFILVAILIDGHTVTLLDPETKLDVNEIAKGFIAEKVGAYLRSRGITGAVIDFGGVIEVIGYKAGWVPLQSEVEEHGDVDGDGIEESVGGIAGGTPFVIGIKNPQSEDGELLGALTTGNKAIVTSELYDKYLEANGKKYHHILSTKTGYPVNTDLISATVVGPPHSALTCDVLSTICLAKGFDSAKEIMAQYPEYGAILIDDTGEITKIGNLPEFTLVGSEEVDLTEEGIKVE